MGKKIGVLTAMSVEFKQIASILTDTKLEKIGPQEFLTGKLDDKTIVLLQCGIGKVNAATGVTNLIINFKPDSVVSESDKAMAETAISLSSDVRIVPGLICTGDQFITNRNQLNVIKATYPDGLAVDMESAAIAQVCHLYDVPFVSFRIISDTPGAEEHFEEYLNFWQTMADKSFAVTRLFLNSL